MGYSFSGSGSTKKLALRRDPSFHFQKHIKEVVDAYKADPTIDLEPRVAEAVESDFPDAYSDPTPADMDAALNEPTNKKIKFEKGQWCEYLGGDMKWHLAQVRRVVRIAPENYDPTSLAEPEWDFYYQFRGGAVAADYDVRASEEALKRIYGHRPWLWQQWALVR